MSMQTSVPSSPRPQPKNPDDCNWGMLAHLSALAVMVFPLGHILAPFIIWTLYRKSSPFVEDQARESLNAQISYSLYGLVAAILTVIIIGFVLLILIWLADIILVIYAALQARKGKAFRYPFIIRFVQ